MLDFILVCSLAIVGAFLHWAKKYGRAQTSDTLFTYIKVHPWHTFTVIAGCILEAAGIVSTTEIDFNNPSFIANVLGASYIIDSLFNKDSGKPNVK